MQATPSAVKISPASPGSTEASMGVGCFGGQLLGSLPSLKLTLNAPKNDGETNRNLLFPRVNFLGIC